MVVPASTQDRAGGIPLVERLRAAVKYIQVLWGDAHFDTALRHAWVRWGWVGVIARKVAGQVGFVPQPKRWIVERTFGWFNRYRRLSKDYEEQTRNSETMIRLAMINVMLHRLSPG